MAKKKKRKKKNGRSRTRAKTTALPRPETNIITQVEELAAKGRGAEAIDLLKRVLAKNPDDAEAWRALGRLHMIRRDYNPAAEAYGRLVQEHPEDISALNGLGTALTMAGRRQEALRVMKRAVDLAPDNPLYLANLGKLYMMDAGWHLAAAYLERALDAAPAEDRWKYQEALSQCRQLATDNPILPRDLTPEDVLTPPPEVLAPPQPAQAADPPAPADAQPVPRPAPLEPTARPLNILFVQEAPCIRNYKLAAALGRRGHRVSLAYTQARLSQMYPGLSDEVYHQCVQLRDHRHLWDLSADYDLVHCHNEPDVLTVAALAGQAPVVHDTHDLISLRADGEASLAFFEGVANRGAAGRVYTTPYQLAEARELYGVRGPCHVHYNYVSAGDLPQRRLPKDSGSDGAVHIVYEGGVGLGGHRDFTRLFNELAAAGVRVHIYPASYNQQVAAVFESTENIFYNQPLSPSRIMEEMTRFDFGIIPFNLELGNRRFLDTTIANKLFEYLAAGLPVLASPLKSYVEYFAANPVGMTFESAEDILANLDRLRQMAAEIDFGQQVFTHESQVPALEEFYYQVIDPAAATQAVSPRAAATPATAPRAVIHRSRPFGQTLAALDQAAAPGRLAHPGPPESLEQRASA